jgi:hypothetical protein
MEAAIPTFLSFKQLINSVNGSSKNLTSGFRTQKYSVAQHLKA